MKFVRARQPAFVIQHLQPFLKLEGAGSKEEAAGHLIQLLEADPSRCYIIIALQDDKLAGFVLGYCAPNTGNLTLGQLFVVDEFKENNVAPKLLEILIKNLSDDVRAIYMVAQNTDDELLGVLGNARFARKASVMVYNLVQEDEILYEMPLSEVGDQNDALREAVESERESLETPTDRSDGRNDEGKHVGEDSGPSGASA